MKYKVNEIFLSVQAEGCNAGRSAVFVRFSGCNLQCPFCDTQHQSFVEMSGAEIDAEIKRLAPDRKTLVVFTGGEPLLQLCDKDELAKGYSRALESNGLLTLPCWWGERDWFTVSPKTILSKEQLSRANEIKVLYGMFDDIWLVELESAFQKDKELYLQAIETNGRFEVEPVIKFINNHPAWKLSVQWHKITGVR